jgi:GNAT superfamily N-acetyltransferase
MTPAERLERTQWDLFWLPPDTTVVDRPELLLVTCPRPVRYLNTVLRTRASPERLPALVAQAKATGRPIRWQVPDTIARAPLEAALSAAGWTPSDDHEARVLPVDTWRSRRPVAVRRVQDLATLRDCVTVAGAAFGRPDTSTDAELTFDLRACVDGTRVSRFVAYDADGSPLASGGLTAFPALGFGLLWAGGTAPHGRGRGAYTALLDARVQRAKQLGLAMVGLYAKRDTSAPIVARQGFAAVGEMRFWDRP